LLPVPLLTGRVSGHARRDLDLAAKGR